MSERRRNHEYVTHEELRAILKPIWERHRESEQAMRLWRELVPLGVEELLPRIVRNARIQQVVEGLAEGRWKRWQRGGAILGTLYVAITLIGGSMAILRTLGWLH